MRRTIICTVCPNSCEAQAEYTGENDFHLSGCACRRGERYCRDECFSPRRVFTASVRVVGADRRMLPVRSSGPVPREKLMACAELTRRMTVRAPVRSHQVLVQNLEGTGVDLIASMTLKGES